MVASTSLMKQTWRLYFMPKSAKRVHVHRILYVDVPFLKKIKQTLLDSFYFWINLMIRNSLLRKLSIDYVFRPLSFYQLLSTHLERGFRSLPSLPVPKARSNINFSKSIGYLRLKTRRSPKISIFLPLPKFNHVYKLRRHVFMSRKYWHKLHGPFIYTFKHTTPNFYVCASRNKYWWRLN